MSNTIDGRSHKAIKFFRKEPAAMAVLWIYASRTNHDNVSWPSARGLAHDTGWGKEACLKARAWLVQHQALEPVKDYVRPDWRELKPAARTRRLNLDKSEYFKPTGKIVVDGKKYPIFYYGGEQSSSIEDETKYPESADGSMPDVRPDLTSGGNGHQAAPDIRPDLTSVPADGRPDRTELITIPNLSPIPSELASNPELVPISSSCSTSEPPPAAQPQAPAAHDDDDKSNILPIEKSFKPIERKTTQPHTRNGHAQKPSAPQPPSIPGGSPLSDNPPLTRVFNRWTHIRTGVPTKEKLAEQKAEIEADLAQYGEKILMAAMGKAEEKLPELDGIWSWNFVRSFYPSKAELAKLKRRINPMDFVDNDPTYDLDEAANQ